MNDVDRDIVQNYDLTTVRDGDFETGCPKRGGPLAVLGAPPPFVSRGSVKMADVTRPWAVFYAIIAGAEGQFFLV